MRTLSGQAAVVQALADRATHLRFFVDRGSGDWVNLSDFEDRDWIHSVTYDEMSDGQIQTATVLIQREDNLLSLSPMMDDSKLNQVATILEIGNPIYIEVAIVPQGTEPTSSDWMEVFRGEIDDPSFEKNPMSIVCRDQGGLLEDTFIEIERPYGSDSGTVIETVMQDILDDHINTPGLGSVTLYSENGSGGTPWNPSDSPGFAIKRYNQRKESVMGALQRLALLIGWSLRYKWQTNTGSFELQFFDPGRQKAAQGTLPFTGNPLNNETFVLNATTFTAKTASPGTDEFLIGATKEETVQNLVDMFNEDSESANAISWRVGAAATFEWLTKGTAGNSVTFTESLSNATADGGGTLGGTQLGTDLSSVHTFSKDRYFDVQKANRGRADIRNVVEVIFGKLVDQRQSIIRTDPASITKNGRRYMAIAEGAASQIDTPNEANRMADAALVDLGEPDLDHAILAPYFPWGESGDVYTFAANGRHYDSDQVLAAVSFRHQISKTQAATIIGVRGKPGSGQKRWLRSEGRPGVASIVELATGPVHTNNEVEHGTINPNPNFGIYTFDSRLNEPDFWKVTEASYGGWGNSAGDFYFDRIIQQTGEFSLKMFALPVPPSGTRQNQVLSGFVEVDEGRLYIIEFTWRHDGDDGNKTTWAPSLTFFKSDRVTSAGTLNLIDTILNYSTGAAQTTTPNTWYKDRGWFIAPTDARYCKIAITANANAAILSPQTKHPALNIDRMALARSNAKMINCGGANDRTIAQNTWVRPWFSVSPDIDNASGFTVGNPGLAIEHQYDVPFDGEYNLSVKIDFLGFVAGTRFAAKITKNGSDLVIGETTSYAVNPGLTSTFATMGPVPLLAGDVLQAWGYQTQPAPPVQIDDSDCFFHVEQTSDVEA